MFLLVGLRIAPLTAGAADENLYDVFRAQVEEERGSETVDQPVIEFLQGVFENRWNLTHDEVQAAVRGQPWKACASENPDATQKNSSECDRALQNIQLISAEEQQLRVFGRSLLRISAAQELPLTEFPGRPFHLATDLSGIINIWRAGTGSLQQTVSGAMLVRTKTLSTAEVASVKEAFQNVAGAVQGHEGNGMNEEYLNGLMWYFQYGARFRDGDRSPRYPPPIDDGKSGRGTERQYMFLRDYSNTVGVFLEAVWDKLPKGPDAFDPPLSENEVAYYLFPDELTDLLPANVIVWARVDRYIPGGGENHPLGDIGLAWKYPVEPLLPSLLSRESERSGKPILGGRYPPEPAIDVFSDDNGRPLPPGSKQPLDGRGLCSMAIAQRGYLCRPLKATSEELCPHDDEQFSEDDNVISLVSCTLEEEPTLTVAGADVCREIEWKNGQDAERPNCVVEADSSEYDLVKVQQRCILNVQDPYAGKSREEQDALCCRLEGEAHLVECKAMVASGVLNDLNGAPLVIDGMKVTPQICMEIMRLKSCTEALGRDVACPVTTPSLTADDADAIQNAANNGTENDPNKAARIEARIRTIERHVPVCTPGTETTYKNTIGNNVCYIGQCTEETLELHRITAGRSPATVSDSAFPYDDPDTGDALATLLRSVPATSPPLPSYRPQLIMRSLEDALCQLQGLPAATPPHLCSFAPSRRLELPLGDGALTAESLVFNADEQREATLLVEQLASGLGSRIGTDIQGQYLRIGTRTLSEVVALANTLLNEALTVTFPTNMCPLSL